MTGTGEAEADFAGEERKFRIRLGEIRRIEAKCGARIGEVLRRLSRCVLVMSQVGGLEALAAGVEIAGDDVRETIYQGLIGHGMPSVDATALVRREIDDRGVRGLLDNASTALTVLWGSQQTPTPEGDGLGEGEAGTTQAPPDPTTSPPSTEPAAPSA